MCDRIGADFILVHVDYPSLPLDHVTQDLEAKAEEAGAKMPEDWRLWTLPPDINLPVFNLRAFIEFKLLIWD